MHTQDQESDSTMHASAKVLGEGSTTDLCDTLPLPDTQLMEYETWDHQNNAAEDEEECEEEACTEDEEVHLDHQIPRHDQNMVDVAPDSLLEVERKALGGGEGCLNHWVLWRIADRWGQNRFVGRITPNFAHRDRNTGETKSTRTSTTCYRKRWREERNIQGQNFIPSNQFVVCMSQQVISRTTQSRHASMQG